VKFEDAQRPVGREEEEEARDREARGEEPQAEDDEALCAVPLHGAAAL
jgi:hypothetical protein